MDQVKAFLEKHVQWIVVGLGGVVLLWALWAFVIQRSVGVELANGFYGPADVDREVLESEGAALNSQITGIGATIPVPEGGLDQEFRRNVTLEANVPQQMLASAFSSRPYVVPEDDEDYNRQIDLNTLPELPIAMLREVGSGRAYVRVPQNAAQPGAGFNEEDLIYAVVRYRLDAAAMSEAFNKAALPPAGRRTNVLQVRAMRQRQMPDGTWGDEQQVAYLRNVALPDMPGDDASMDEKRRYVEQTQDLADAIVQPDFYEIISGIDPDTVAVGEDGVPVDGDDEFPGNPNGQFPPRGNGDTGDGSRTPGSPYPGGGYPGGYGPGGYGGPGGYDGSGNPYSPGNNGGNNRGNSNGPRSDSGDTNPGNDDILLGQDRDNRGGSGQPGGSGPGGYGQPGGSGPGGYGQPGGSGPGGYDRGSGSYDPSAGRTPSGPANNNDRDRRDRRNTGTNNNDDAPADAPVERRAQLGVVPNDFDPNEFPNGIDGYIIDEQVQQGETYRYNIVYSIRNPLFDTQNLAPANMPQLVEQLPLSVSTQSDEWQTGWSEPLTVESLTYWYMVNKLPDNRVTFRVFRWQNGQWQKSDFKVEPGDSLGEVVDGVDYRTGQVLVDVRTDPSTNDAYSLLLDKVGRFARHSDEDRNLPRFEELQRASDAVASSN